MVGKIRLPKRKGKYVLIFRAFKKISGIKYYGVKFTEIII